MATNNISIGQKIKTIRKRKGFTQAALAEAIGRSSTYISYIESGFKSMSLDTFVLIVHSAAANGRWCGDQRPPCGLKTAG